MTTNPKASETLIIGGTGKTGRRVADRLRALGHTSRIASRSHGTPFDWSNQDTWEPALRGCTAAYLSYAPDLAVDGSPEKIGTISRLATDLGVHRIVLLSGRGEAEAQRAEQALARSGAQWTVVRASWFNQNFSEGNLVEPIRAGMLALPVGQVGEPFVDADDIADVAVAAFTEPGHAGEIYEVTGPRLLTFDDVSTEISKALGSTVRFERITAEAFSAELADLGEDTATIELLNFLFTEVLDGRNEYLTDGVQRALHREPKDFRDFVAESVQAGVWS